MRGSMLGEGREIFHSREMARYYLANSYPGPGMTHQHLRRLLVLFVLLSSPLHSSLA